MKEAKGTKETADPCYLEAWRHACDIIVQGVCVCYPDVETRLQPGEPILPYGHRYLEIYTRKKWATVVCHQSNPDNTTHPSFGLQFAIWVDGGEPRYLDGSEVGFFDTHFDELINFPEEVLTKLLDFFSTP